MIIRTFSSLFLWSTIAGIVYAMDEIGAMWVLNLCATLTLFEIYHPRPTWLCRQPSLWVTDWWLHDPYFLLLSRVWY